MKSKKSDIVQVERRGGKERRERRTEDRRTAQVPVAVERRKTERRKVQRRRQIDPTTCERDYSAEEIEFMTAMDNYKRTSGRMFPTCSEILEVIHSLGYTRVAAPSAESPMPAPSSESPTPDAASEAPTAGNENDPTA